MWGLLCVPAHGMNTQFQVRSEIYVQRFLLYATHRVRESFYLHTEKGIPNRLASVNNHSQPLSSSVLPSSETAVQHFEALGGNITLFSPFGSDPLSDHPELVAERERQFYSSYLDFAPIFHKLTNGPHSTFRGWSAVVSSADTAACFLIHLKNFPIHLKNFPILLTGFSKSHHIYKRFKNWLIRTNNNLPEGVPDRRQSKLNISFSSPSTCHSSLRL